MPLSRQEINELKSMLKVARKREVNFALCLENDVSESVLLLHRRKSPDILLRRAQAIGDTSKLAMGRLRMEGKMILLDCDIEAPQNCARQLRLFLREIGTSAQVKVTDLNGVQDSVLKSADAPDPAVLEPFIKTQALWAATRTKMDSDITKLQSAIVDVCGTDPDLQSVVDEIADLPAKLDVFDDELDSRLNDLINCVDGSSLDASKAQARATVQEYETILNDPFFADLDTNNGFAKIAVTASAKQALSAISKALI